MDISLLYGLFWIYVHMQMYMCCLKTVMNRCGNIGWIKDSDPETKTFKRSMFVWKGKLISFLFWWNWIKLWTNKLKNESFVFTQDVAKWCHRVCTTTLTCVEQQFHYSPLIEPQYVAHGPAKATMPLTNIHPIRTELEHWPECFCWVEFSEFQVTFINTCRQVGRCFIACSFTHMCGSCRHQ